MLCPRKATRKNLTDNDRPCVGLLSGRGNPLDRAKDLGHPLGLVGEEQRNLGTDNLARGAARRSSLLPGNRSTPALNDKLVEVLTPHKLRNLSSKLRLSIAKSLDLGLKSTDLVVDTNPLTERLANLVGHLLRDRAMSVS